MSTRTPRRDGAEAPLPPPPGLVVSKLGVQATASGDTALGLLCLKITLPRDVESQPDARWGLFSGEPPKLRSIPALYPLPASPALLRSPRSAGNLATATELLKLSPAPYPPAPAVPLAQRPVIDVSAKTGQVFVCLDRAGGVSGRRGSLSAGSTPSTPKREGAPGGSAGSGGAGTRTEWLVVMEVEMPVESTAGPSGVDQLWSVRFATPRCLDNIIRFQVLAGDEGKEVSIITEPKVVPLAANWFSRRPPARRHRRRSLSSPSSPSKILPVGLEDGWEDGEVPGADLEFHEDVNEETDDEEQGSWLQGLFQSTDRFTISWGYVPSLGSPSDLKIAPRWGAHHSPSISVAYEVILPPAGGPLSLDAVVPPGWGWSELEIRGDGLLSWYSTDGDSGLRGPPASGSGADDSVSTINGLNTPLLEGFRPLRPFSTPGPLLPPMLENGEFSFEQSMDVNRSPAAPTPCLRRTLTAKARDTRSKVTPRIPAPASNFVLEFELGPAEDDEDGLDDEERVLLVEGKLEPLPLTLVSPDTPVPIPFLRFDDPSLTTMSMVVCPGASYTLSSAGGSRLGDSAASLSPLDGSSRLCDTTLAFIGQFMWTDADGHPLAPRALRPVTGSVHVVVQRNVWGVQTVSTALTWPHRSEEIVVRFASPSVRVLSATSGERQLARTVLVSDGDGEAGGDIGYAGAASEVRVGGGRNKAELVLEVADDHGVALPAFPDGSGELLVELAGDGWEKLVGKKPETGHLAMVAPNVFRGDLAAPPPTIPFAQTKPAAKPAYRPVWASMSVLINLALIYSVVSLAGQVQRLHAQVAFVADEARDLRLYGFAQTTQPQPVQGMHEQWAEWEARTHSVSPPDPDPAHAAEHTEHSGHTHAGHSESTNDGYIKYTPLSEPRGLAEEHGGQDRQKAGTGAAGPLWAGGAARPTEASTREREPSQGGQPGVKDRRAPGPPQPQAPPPPPPPTLPPHATVGAGGAVAPAEQSYGLGRVVFGRGSGWEWAQHPAIKSVTSTVSWLWQAVVWLLR